MSGVDYRLIIVLLLFTAVPLIGFGHARLAVIRKSNDKRKRWLPTVALGLGYSCLAISVFLVVFILHGLYRLAQLDSAIVTVRELVAAEIRFAESHPKQGYTCGLADLPTNGWILEGASALTKTGQRNGYSFEIKGCQKADGKANPTYEIIARPQSNRDPQGGDDACADQSGVVHFNDPDCDQK
jgi:hypothetical protein